MSKYLLNKLIHFVNMNESAEDEYTANPRAFVEKWEKTQKLKLEPEEREALASKDYGKLYALGAHPFTLWSFTEAVWVHEKPREELISYCCLAPNGCCLVHYLSNLLARAIAGFLIFKTEDSR